MEYIDRVLAREERLRAEFEDNIYEECDYCYEPILFGDDFYSDGYKNICEKCMDKFESKRA